MHLFIHLLRIGCQPTYNKDNGRIVFESIQNKNVFDSCTFTILTGKPNSTISVYFSKFDIVNTMIESGENYLKVPAIQSVISTTNRYSKYIIFISGVRRTVRFFAVGQHFHLRVHKFLESSSDLFDRPVVDDVL